MKCLFYIMVVLMLPLLAIRCTQKDDDYYTQAMVTLQVPDTITPIEMQGTVVLKKPIEWKKLHRFHISRKHCHH